MARSFSTDQALRKTDPTGIVTANKYTCGAYVYRTGANTNKSVIIKIGPTGTGLARGVVLYVDHNSIHALTVEESTGYSRQGGSVGTNTWSRVAFGRNGSASWVGVKCVLNGTAYEFEDSSDGRHNPQGRIVQASGTGNFVGGPTGGYSRDASEDRAYVRCWAFVDGPSAGSTYQFEWKRDSDAPGGGDGTVRSVFQVIPFYYSDIAMYASTDHTVLGGTTPNVVSSWSTVVEGTNITRSGDVVTVAGENKRYLVLMSQFFEDRVGRTQRWHGMDIDGSEEHAAKAYSYYRLAADDESGEMFTRLLETATASVTIEQTCYRGMGVANGEGGADIDGSDPSVGDHAIVVIELNDSAKVFRCTGSTNQNLATSGPVDVQASKAGDVDFSDGESWTRASDTAMNAEKAMDALIGANVSAASENVSSGSRWTGYAEIHVNGTEDGKSFAGDYLRGNQATQDTFGWSANTLHFEALSSGDDVGISVTELLGSEGGGGAVHTQVGWVGWWGINLDTLAGAVTHEAAASLEASASLGATAILAAHFRMKASPYIAASGENTSAQLSAPAGKSTADFGGGRIQDDENPGDAVDLAEDEYREDEWNVEATEYAVADATYQFRVVFDDDTELDTYTVTPQWTVGAAAIEGAAALDAVAELTASAEVTRGGAAALEATGEVASAGQLEVGGAAAMEVAATVGAAGHVARLAAAAVEAVAEVAVAGVLALLGAAAVDATATVAVAATVEHTAATALDAAAELVVAATVEHTGQVDLQAAAEVAGTGHVSRYGAAALEAAAELAATSTVEHLGTAALEAVTELAATASAEHTGATAIEAAVEVAATAQVDHEAAAVLEAAAELAVAGTVEHTGVAALEAVAELAAAGAVAGIHTGSAALEATAELAAAGVVEYGGAAALEAVAELAAAGQAEHVGQAALEAVAEVASVGHVTRYGAAALEAVAEIAATSAVEYPAAAAVEVAAELVAAASVEHTGAVAMQAVAQLAASAAIEGLVQGAVALEAVAEVAAAAQVDFSATTALEVAASVAATAEVEYVAAALLETSAELAAIAEVEHTASAPLEAAAALSATATVQRTGAAGLIAFAECAAAGTIEGLRLGTASLVTEAHLAAVAQVAHAAVASLVAAGELVGAAEVEHIGAASLAASAEIQAIGSIALPGAAALQVEALLVAPAVVDHLGAANLQAAAELIAQPSIEYSAAAVFEAAAELTATGLLVGKFTPDRILSAVIALRLADEQTIIFGLADERTAILGLTDHKTITLRSADAFAASVTVRDERTV